MSAALVDEEAVLLTVLEAAKLLRLSRDQVYRMAARGDIPSVPIGRSVRFRRTSLIEWLERLERGGPK